MKKLNIITITLAACIFATTAHTNESTIKFDTITIANPAAALECLNDANTAVYFFNVRHDTSRRRLNRAITIQPISDVEKSRLKKLVGFTFLAKNKKNLHNMVTNDCVQSE